MNELAAIVLNYNDYKTTIKLVNRISSYNILNHIVIVDNFSSDDSLNYLLMLESDRVRVIRTDKNGGYGYGNNKGIEYAQINFPCKYYLVCNPDIEFDEGLIVKMKSALEIEDIYMCASAIPYQPNGKIQSGYAWRVPTVICAVLGTGKILQKFFSFGKYSDDYCMKNEITEVECVPGSLLLLKSQCLEDNKIYDEAVFLYFEETILGFKLKEKGFKTIIVKGEYIHHHSVSINKTISSTVEQRRIMYKSLMLFLTKYLQINDFTGKICRLYLDIVICENYFDELIRVIKNLRGALCKK